MKPVKITGTRTFSSDSAGMPVSRKLALAEQQEQEPESRRGEPSEADVRTYLLATGIEPVEHQRFETAEDGYLAATGVPARPKAAEPEPAESKDPLGDAYLVATTLGFA